MMRFPLVVLLVLPINFASSFVAKSPSWKKLGRPSSPQFMAGASVETADDSVVQWELFKKHHGKGSWQGIWNTYDYMGDIVDETLASVNLIQDEDLDVVMHSQDIVMGGTVSDCDTCFDSLERRTMPIGSYSLGKLGRHRCASVGMVNGPSLLRSGAMATELALSHGDGRIRVILQHAPVWEKGVEPGSGPPQGLKLLRAMISKEALRPTPPTPQSEATNPPSGGNPSLYRGTPPFQWRKRWTGTSWTWGPQNGNRGWQLDEMEEADAWHGRPTGDGPNVWNLLLARGGILIQCPRVVTNDEVGLFRLAWIPEGDSDEGPAKLLRIEAGVSVLQPMEETVPSENVRFLPPMLTSLRCDVLESAGDLDSSEDEESSGIKAIRDAMRP